ncbi:MAG: FAD-dependent oxidoreductase [Gemmatimonadetes bacterium]|nr:FAD-dependent oxidoreductase [Gemmatimonadota bacterium]
MAGHRRAPILPVAVVGAGISGLSAARSLREHGLEVRVFEKSRGLGGRSATRRIGELSFDHGAQYFTIRDERWAQAVAPLEEQGVIARWEPRIVRVLADGAVGKAKVSERYVGIPGMSALGGALARDNEVVRETRIASLLRSDGGGWNLASDDGPMLGPFSAVVVTCPAPQAADLLDDVAPALAASCRAAVMHPCWAAMVAFGKSLGLDFDAAFVDDPVLAWAACESSKPGRATSPEGWTLHATPEWSAERIEDPAGEVAEVLLRRFLHLVAKAEELSPVIRVAHRWRFARSAQPRSLGQVVDSEALLGVAGDWTGGDRLEGAFLSGVRVADAIADALSPAVG